MHTFTFYIYDLSNSNNLDGDSLIAVDVPASDLESRLQSLADASGSFNLVAVTGLDAQGE